MIIRKTQQPAEFPDNNIYDSYSESTNDAYTCHFVNDFVNSSIGTNTANYISNSGNPFTSLAQLESYSGTVTNNDYAFITGTDDDGNTFYDRYKATVSGSTVTWAKEYRLNNSSFTAAQWAAITSGITSSKVSTYDGYATNKQDTLVSGTNIKSINNQSILGSGNITIQGVDSVPIGAMMFYPSAIAPDNWLKCDGSLLLRSEYPELFAVLGISHNEPTDSDSRYFRLPNVKGRTIVGVDTNDSDFNDVGIKLGEKTHTLTINEMPSHNHTMSNIIAYSDVSAGVSNNALYQPCELSTKTTTETGGGQAHNNLQPSLTEYCYIKAFKNVPLTEEAEVVNTESDSTTDVYSSNYVNNNFESKPVILYENENGTSSDITLSDSASNYEYIEIFFRDNNGNSPNSIKFKGTGLLCLSTYENPQYMNVRVSNYSLSGNSLSFIMGKYYQIIGGNESEGNYIKIYQVIGYK